MLYIFFLLIYIINFYKLSAFKIPFYFKDRPLIDIINEVSLKNGVYFLYPLHPQDFSEFRELVINYKSKELFVDRLKALDLVIYFLNIAGFGVYKAKDNFYIILKVKAINDDSILRYNLPLYINSALDDLPKNDIFIRYLFIFSKLKVDDQNSKILNDILLKLSNENILLSTIFKDFNSILVSGPSNKIKELIYILKSLDNSIENSTFCIVDLDNVTSNYVINIINNLKNAISFDYKSHIFYDNKSQFYNINFNTRLIPFEKNRIIILGSESHVDSLASFIKDELDVIEDNGKSILHTYNLNYLDAQSIAPIIQGILDNNQTSLSQANSIEKGYNFNGAQVLAEYNASSAQKSHLIGSSSVCAPLCMFYLCCLVRCPTTIFVYI
jgi:general secretion pathway protein D